MHLGLYLIRFEAFDDVMTFCHSTATARAAAADFAETSSAEADFVLRFALGAALGSCTPLGGLYALSLRQVLHSTRTISWPTLATTVAARSILHAPQ